MNVLVLLRILVWNCDFWDLLHVIIHAIGFMLFVSWIQLIFSFSYMLSHVFSDNLHVITYDSSFWYNLLFHLCFMEVNDKKIYVLWLEISNEWPHPRAQGGRPSCPGSGTGLPMIVDFSCLFDGCFMKSNNFIYRTRLQLIKFVTFFHLFLQKLDHWDHTPLYQQTLGFLIEQWM